MEKKNTKKKETEEGKVRFDFKRVFTMENLLKAAKGRISRIITVILAVVVLVICFGYAYDYTKATIGDGAYKYSDDSYTYIEESLQNYLGPEGPDIALLQECIPRWTSSYEDGETTLVCTLKDGFFVAEITAQISKDFELKETKRNFNSLEEYQDYFWHEVKISTFKIGIGLFLLIAIAWLLGSSLLLFILKRIVEKKTSKATENTENANGNDTVEVELSSRA